MYFQATSYSESVCLPMKSSSFQTETTHSTSNTRFLHGSRQARNDHSNLEGFTLWPALTEKPAWKLQPENPEQLQQRFEETLALHLWQMKMASASVAPLLDTYFPLELVSALAPMIATRVKYTMVNQRQGDFILNRGWVAYQVTTLPVAVHEARNWFTNHFGGYISLLQQAQSACFSPCRDCNVWCHIIYGFVEEHDWVYVAIVPLKDSEPMKKALFPVRFLTGQEQDELGW